MTHLIEGHVSLMAARVGTTVKDRAGKTHTVEEHVKIVEKYGTVWVRPPKDYKFVGSNMRFTTFERDFPHPK